jgi:iron-sulfur cluster assembly accessory protein
MAVSSGTGDAAARHDLRQLSLILRRDALNYGAGFHDFCVGAGEMTGTVTISERAARRIGEILQSEGDGAKMRISVEGGGCSGFQYKFDVERTQADDDLVIARDGAVVLVDPASAPFLAGSEVDFVDDLIGASFRVVNPNATASCGCGTSFSI